MTLGKQLQKDKGGRRGIVRVITSELEETLLVLLTYSLPDVWSKKLEMFNVCKDICINL